MSPLFEHIFLKYKNKCIFQKTVTESISIMSTLLNGIIEYKITLEKITNIRPVEFKKLIIFLDGLSKRILRDRDIEVRPKIMLNDQDGT